MEREQVIEGLKCCSANDCSGCPYEDGTSQCITKIAKDALTQITIKDEAESMTWAGLYKQFIQEYPQAKAVDYRPFVEWYLPAHRPGIIVWLENGDVLVYMPEKREEK